MVTIKKNRTEYNKHWWMYEEIRAFVDVAAAMQNSMAVAPPLPPS